METAIRPRLDIVLFMTPERLTRFRNLHSSVGISRTGRNSRSGSRLQVPSVLLSTPSKLQLEVPNITFRPRRNIRLYKISRGYVHLQDLYLLFEIVRRKRNSRGGRKCFSLRRPAWPPDHIPKTKTIVSSGFNNRNATAIRTTDSFVAKLTTVGVGRNRIYYPFLSTQPLTSSLRQPRYNIFLTGSNSAYETREKAVFGSHQTVIPAQRMSPNESLVCICLRIMVLMTRPQKTLIFKRFQAFENSRQRTLNTAARFCHTIDTSDRGIFSSDAAHETKEQVFPIMLKPYKLAIPVERNILNETTVCLKF
jgi:hypothetical protein